MHACCRLYSKSLLDSDRPKGSSACWIGPCEPRCDTNDCYVSELPTGSMIAHLGVRKAGSGLLHTSDRHAVWCNISVLLWHSQVLFRLQKPFQTFACRSNHKQEGMIP